MNLNVFARLILILGVMPLISSPAFSQGIGEYGGVMGLPRNLPTGKSKSTLNKLYGSSARTTSNVSRGVPKQALSRNSASSYSGMQRKKRIAQQGRKAQADLVRARALAKEKKFDEAIKYYNSSLKIRLQYWKGRDKSIPEIYKELAEIYAGQGKMDKAENALKGAISSYSRRHGPGSKHITYPLEKLGDLYDKKGDHWKSHDHYLQAYMLTERYSGKDSVKAMNLRLNLAKKANDLGKLKRAADFYQKALVINNEKNILSVVELTKVLQDYAGVLKGLKMDGEAKKLEEQALAISKKASSDDSDAPKQSDSNTESKQ